MLRSGLTANDVTNTIMCDNCFKGRLVNTIYIYFTFTLYYLVEHDISQVDFT